MKSYINIVLLTAILITALTGCQAQINNRKTETVKIYGNCGMCKKTIETAAFVKNEVKAEWDVDSKMVAITYDSTQTTLDDVLKRIAEVGYDSDKFTAPDDVYNDLPGCCQYDRPMRK